MSLTDKLRKLEAFSFCLLHISVLQGIKALERFLFIYFTFWLHWVFAVRGLSPVVETGSYSLAVVHGPLILVAFLFVHTGLSSCDFLALVCGLSSFGAWAWGLNCSSMCGLFPDQGLNLCPLDWQADCYPLNYQGSP